MKKTTYTTAMDSIHKIFFETEKSLEQMFDELMEDPKNGAGKYLITEEQYVELVHMCQDGVWMMKEIGLMA